MRLGGPQSQSGWVWKTLPSQGYNPLTIQCIVSHYTDHTTSARITRGVSKKFGEWYQKTNKTEDTNKLTLLAFKIIAIIHNTLLATSIKLLQTVSKGLFRNRSQNHCHTFLGCDRFLNRPLLTVSRSFMNVANSVLWMMAIILKANKVNLFVSSVLSVFWYHSPICLDTPRII
jgi:hypothetical protein